jgi:hypothetical protein
MARQKKEKKQMSDDFIPMDGLGNIKEPGLIETEGVCPLIVKSAEKKEKNEKKYIEVIVEIQGQEDSIQGIFNNLYLPAPGHDKKAKEFLMLLIARFYTAFGVPYEEGVVPKDLIGAQADLPVTKTFYKDKTGKEVPKNEIVIPNLPDEG